MARSNPSHLVVGYLNKPHGIKGEIAVSSLTDHPESVFASGVVLYLGARDADEPDPDLPPLRVETMRPIRRGLLVRFGGVDDRTQAELLCGRYLFCPIDRLEPLREGEVFYHQLVGMAVETVAGDDVGTVGEVYELAPADLLQVHGPYGTVMIPYRPEIVLEVDVEGARLVVDLPEGLLELGSG